MTDEALEARRAYKRKWSRDNRDKVAEYQRRYWERKAQQEQKEGDEHSKRETANL